MQGFDGFRLVMRRGPQPNQAYELNKDVITIGRDITNDIVINDPEVSRHHLRFTRTEDGYTLEDLGSTNGTFINGQRMSGFRPMNNGDMIGLGETVTLGYERKAYASETVIGGGMANRAPQQPAMSYGSSVMDERGAGQMLNPTPISPQRADQRSDFYGISNPPQQQLPAQPVSNYEYQEEEPRRNPTLRFVLIGCGALFLFCCCATLVSAFIIDQNCLWDEVPLLSNVLESIGYTENPSMCS